MKIALITGASSGLGAEFVRQIDENDKYDIDEFWLVARRREKLEKLAGSCRTPCRIFSLDLSKRESVLTIKEALESSHPTIAFLVCAAGLGRIGKTTEMSIDDNDMTIDINCKAAVDVTTVSLPYVKEGSRILEICSTPGFQPMPTLNIYSASKAFLISYTKCLHYEMLGSGVHITAVCPYWIKDTEFISGAEKKSKGYGHYPLANKAKTVARWALFDSKVNFWVSTPGPICFAHRIFAWIIPNVLTVPFVDAFRHI